MINRVISTIMAAALIGVGSTPAAASPVERQAGAFAGARLRVALGADVSTPKAQFGIAFAPMLRTQAADGRTQVQLGEGASLGFNARGSTQFLLGGRPIAGLASQRTAIDTKRAAGVSTLGYIAIGIGVAAVLVVAAGVACQETNCLNSD